MFKDYAKYYDAVYSQKNYPHEVDYLKRAHASFAPAKDTDFGNLLELGCGTGGHALHLAPYCQSYTGIDLSAQMIKVAKEKTAHLPLTAHFGVCDLARQDLDLPDGHYDTVIALFHVFSYFTEDKALSNLLSNIRRKLRPGGTLIFDFWHSEGVQHLGLQTRQKEFPFSGGKIIRRVGPGPMAGENTSNIAINLRVYDQESRMVEEFDESHPMRYFSAAQVTSLLVQWGFKVSFVVGEGKDDIAQLPTREDWGAIVKANL